MGPLAQVDHAGLGAQLEGPALVRREPSGRALGDDAPIVVGDHHAIAVDEQHCDQDPVAHASSVPAPATPPAPRGSR
jgi:hypothetical protein